MMRKLKHFIPSLYQNTYLFPIIIFTVLSFFWTMSVSAQNNVQLFGPWQLQRVSYKKKVVQNSESNKEPLLNIFKAALYNQLTDEQQSNLNDLEQVNSDAEILLDTYYQTTIEFQANGAFYNTSTNKDKSLSGEYLLDKNKLILEWETGEKNNLKIFIITPEELVLKDTELKVTYYYIKD